MHIEACCAKEGWVGARQFTAENAGLPWVEEGAPAVLSTKETPVWHKVKLTPKLVNLYDCNSYIIKPATVPKQCSYVELIGEKAALQMPKWFVSHWCAHRMPNTHPNLSENLYSKCNLLGSKRSGEPVYQFIPCLLQHAKDHYYSAADNESFVDVPYWVCTRKQTAHQLADMRTNSHQAHTHARVMRVCVGMRARVCVRACVRARRGACAYTCVCTCTHPHSFAGMCIRQQSACSGE